MVSWLLGSGAVGFLAACCWALIERAQRAGADARADRAELEAKLQRAVAENIKSERDALKARADEERARLEQLVIQMKRDAALAWESYGACVESGSAVGDVAAHLQRLLATPIGGVGRESTASAVVVSGGQAP